jgi:DNA-binding CsgD family transcriptional regulator
MSTKTGFDSEAISAPPAPAGDANPLSEREMDVARLLATGLSNAEIARSLVISPHTVKVHLRNIFEKLAVNSRTEASMVLVQRGWLELPGAVRGAEEEPEETPAPTPPEPEPLGNLPPQVARWQWTTLLAAVLVCVALLALPAWQVQGRTSPPLLSDAGTRARGAPALSLDSRWQTLAPLPRPRSRLAVVRHDQMLYAIGGETDGGRIVDDATAYDLTVNSWRTVAALPQPTSNLAAAVLDGAIYVAGGNHASPAGGEPVFSGELWRYTPEDDAWEEVGALPAPVAGAALAADDNSLYLVGGWDGQAVRDEIWSLTPGADEGDAARWQLVGRLDGGRAFLGATVRDGLLYVVGGFDGQRELARADALDLATGTWRALPDMAQARSGFALADDGVALFALGGGWIEPVNALERFDPAANVWTNFASPVPDEWRHLGAAGGDGQLYLMGGWAGDHLSTNLTYQSTFRSLLPVITNP